MRMRDVPSGPDGPGYNEDELDLVKRIELPANADDG
jgi:hypothetical protein